MASSEIDAKLIHLIDVSEGPEAPSALASSMRGLQALASGPELHVLVPGEEWGPLHATCPGNIKGLEIHAKAPLLLAWGDSFLHIYALPEGPPPPPGRLTRVAAAENPPKETIAAASFAPSSIYGASTDSRPVVSALVGARLWLLAVGEGPTAALKDSADSVPGLGDFALSFDVPVSDKPLPPRGAHSTVTWSSDESHVLVIAAGGATLVSRGAGGWRGVPVLSPGGPVRAAAALSDGSFALLQQATVLVRGSNEEQKGAGSGNGAAAEASAFTRIGHGGSAAASLGPGSAGGEAVIDLRGRVGGSGAAGAVESLLGVGGREAARVPDMFMLRGGVDGINGSASLLTIGPAPGTRASPGADPSDAAAPAQLSILVPPKERQGGDQGPSGAGAARSDNGGHAGAMTTATAHIALGVPLADLLSSDGTSLVAVGCSGLEPTVLLYRCSAKDGVQPVAQARLDQGGVPRAGVRPRLRAISLGAASIGQRGSRGGFVVRLSALIGERKGGASPFLSGPLAGGTVSVRAALYDIEVPRAAPQSDEGAAAAAAGPAEATGAAAGAAAAAAAGPPAPAVDPLQALMAQLQGLVGGLQSHLDSRLDGIQRQLEGQEARLRVLEQNGEPKKG